MGSNPLFSCFSVKPARMAFACLFQSIAFGSNFISCHIVKKNVNFRF